MRSLKTVLALILLGACGNVSHPIDVDALTDVVATVDAPQIDTPDGAIEKRKGGVVATSGGGTTASSQHKLRVRIAAPQPMGRAASAGHNLITGPGALP
jgi:hypothetical protein